MPRNGTRNFSVDAGFIGLIHEMRVKRGLTKAELACRAGLTERTIRDLEAGRRETVQEKTVMLLAEALGVDPEELYHRPVKDDDRTGRPQADEPRRRFVPAGIALSVIIIICGGALVVWRTSTSGASWEIENQSLIVRDTLFDRELWHIDGPVRACIQAPWSSDQLIVGLSRQYAVDNSVLCLKRATGDTIWAVGPDVEAVRRAFGTETVDAAGFGCADLATGDIQGDGEPELVVWFVHGLYYPSAIAVFDRHGNMESQYTNKGHLFDLVVEDINSDGADEIIFAGVNNDSNYLGATIGILDDRHRHGATVDDLANPANPEIDRSRSRVVIPRFPEPYMEFLKIIRITAERIRLTRIADGDTHIMVHIGSHKVATYNATFDSDLRLVNIVLEDIFKQEILPEMPDSLKVDTGLEDEQWREEWLSGMRVFRAGKPIPPTVDLFGPRTIPFGIAKLFGRW